jgi:hypothetical protein
MKEEKEKEKETTMSKDDYRKFMKLKKGKK